MKRIVSITVAAMLAFALFTPLLAGDDQKQVKLTGWITDEWCGKANANAEGKGCAVACAKKGAKLVLYANDKIYQLSDQDGAKANLGHEVVVTGTIDADDNIQVKKYQAKKKDAA